MDLATSTRNLKTAFDAIKAKQRTYNEMLAYYDGNQPTVYLTQRLREIFRGVDVEFVENWCAVVIDTCRDRINLKGFSIKDRKAQAAIDRLWESNELAIESDDIHTHALVCGEAFLIVWPDDTGETGEAYFNDPRMVHMVYDATNPRKKAYAGKLWTDDNDKARMTMYYPDHLEYWSTTQKSEDVTSANAFNPIAGDALRQAQGATGANWPNNPYGIVPVFHFRNNRRMVSDLNNVVPLQNGINKLLSDMMVAAEFGAYKQRWVISQSTVEGRISSAPGTVMDLPAGDGVGQGTQVGEFTATDLKNYLDSIDNLSGAIGKITHTPKHYFYNGTGDPSGEALIALEAPLNKKASERIKRFGPVWRQVGAFLLQIAGISMDWNDITVTFDKPETVQPMTQAVITKTYTDARVPLVTALRWEGRNEAELAQLKKDAQDEKAESTAVAQQILQKLRMKDAMQNPDALNMPMDSNGGISGGSTPAALKDNLSNSNLTKQQGAK